MKIVNGYTESKRNASKINVDNINNKDYTEIYDLLLKQKSRNVYIKLPNGNRVYSLFDSLTSCRQAFDNKKNLSYQDEIMDIRNACIKQGENFVDPTVKKNWDDFVVSNTDILFYSLNMEVFSNLLNKIYKTEAKDYEMLSDLVIKYQRSGKTLSRISFHSTDEEKNKSFFEDQLSDTLLQIAYYIKDKKGIEFVNFILDKGNLSDRFTTKMKKCIQELDSNNSSDLEKE